jgi:hypothetical protein
MKIHSKQEAMMLAKESRTIPNDVIEELNKTLVEGYAYDKKEVIFYRVSCSMPVWNAIQTQLKNTGYQIKLSNSTHPKDGEWLYITL